MEQVLTLVVRVEKNARPAQTDALETAARAVLAILADDRSSGDGEWAAAMNAWQDNRIRKITKRARGAEWRRAEALPGITLTGTGAGSAVRAADSSKEDEPGGGELRAVVAVVRVFPPTAVDEVPAELFKLQVSGTDFEDTAELPPVRPGTPVLWLSPALEMSSGKAMAQCGHAAQLAWWALSDSARKEWQAVDFALAVRAATPAQWTELLRTDLPVVQDAGFTEIAPGSKTVISDHPRLTR